MYKKLKDINDCIVGQEMHDLVAKMFDYCRSITGDGVRKTLGTIREYVPDISVHEIPSGTNCFDWIVPNEWNIKDAYILDEKGNKIVDFKKNNLHIVGYSIPVNKEIWLDELQEHLFSLQDQPDAIPYVTSYYKPFWGFCLKHSERKKLKNQKFRVFIDSKLEPGSMTYADLLIPGKSKKEIFVSTYICHPSMANNELSGPVLSTFLIKWLKNQKNFYTYRFVFIPETIGSVVYLSRHLQELRENTIAAFNLSCVGDDREISFLPSRKGNSLTDKIARHVLKYKAPNYKEYKFISDRGSDERQYCSPGVDLPMVLIMRSKFGTYPEYHTSLDNLSVVTPSGLQTSFDIHKECFKLLEGNNVFRSKIIGEPQLSRRGIEQQLGGYLEPSKVRLMIQNFLICCDGKTDLVTIAEEIGVYAGDLYPIIKSLMENNLIEKSE